MISSTTHYKLSDIIRDTWPQLYRTPTLNYTVKTHKTNDVSNTKTSTN